MCTHALRRRASVGVLGAACLAAAFGGAAAADPPPGDAPRCEQGQLNAWANDPTGGLFHAGKLFSCFLDQPPATDPTFSFGPAPRCENGQANAWANDPSGGLDHAGKLEACFLGEPPGSGP
jgi:hypothetical protein